MTDFDLATAVQQATARFNDRMAKHRCVRCGDQLEDGDKRLVCDRCQPQGDDYAADHRADSPQRGQARGLNAMIRSVP